MEWKQCRHDECRERCIEHRELAVLIDHRWHFGDNPWVQPSPDDVAGLENNVLNASRKYRTIRCAQLTTTPTRVNTTLSRLQADGTYSHSLRSMRNGLTLPKSCR